MMRSIFVILMLMLCVNVFAQDIEIKGLKTISESSANASARKDINGNVCALVRVQLKEPDAQFSGNILGDISYKNGEYWVYMAMGSKRLSIKHPDFLPVTVVFSTLGVDKVKSGAEYQMQTKANKEKPKAVSNKRGMVAIQLTPSNATLSVDGTPATSEGGGQYTLSLPYGTHYYSVKYGDFAIEDQAVKVDKQPKAINVDLTEYFAKMKVNSKENASIYINDELRGVGSCDELVTPGKYVIQARKDGYHPLSQTVVLEDNEDFSMIFNEMKAITGTLRVAFDPIGADVYLDGKKVGVTPLNLKDVALGKHKLEIKKSGCTPERREILLVDDEKELMIEGSLKMPFYEVLLNEAAKGNGCAMTALGLYYAYDIFKDCIVGKQDLCCYNSFYVKAIDNGDIHFVWDDEEDNGPSDVIHESRIYKAIGWFKKASEAKFTHNLPSGNCSAMLNLSTCYAALSEFKDAFYWVNKCAQEYTGHYGDPYYYLAWFYYYGKGVSRDVDMAKKIAQKVVGREILASRLDSNAPSAYHSVNEVLNSYDVRCMSGFYGTPSTGSRRYLIGGVEEDVFCGNFAMLDDKSSYKD